MIELMLAAAAFVQAADPCHAINAPPRGCPAWRPVFRDGGRDVTVDPASVRRSGATFEIRHRAIFAEPLDGARSVIMTYRFDCSARTVATVHVIFYDVNGVPVSQATMTGADAAPRAAPPASHFGAMLTEFCTP